jgi:fumarylacetoacetase
MSWLPIPTASDFSIHNLPFGIFDPGDGRPRAGMAIGDQILDLAAAAEAGIFGNNAQLRDTLARTTLNAFIALGKPVTNKVREQVAAWLSASEAPAGAEKLLHNRQAARMHMPVEVGDYTDFYSSIEHATNVGSMFRPDNPLMPNWKWLPVAYHGRSSSVVISGTELRRPQGQQLPKGAEQPVFGPSKALDFELEMAFVIGKNSGLGQPIALNDAEEYIFGMVLFNDWSARDIQRWEYQPLGPFLGKNFGSSVSPWIVPLEALQPFRTDGPTQDPQPLDYLKQSKPGNYDIALEVAIQPEGAAETTICHSNTRYLYWSIAQQLAHHTVNGCNVRIGDMMASGTISGPEQGRLGSLLEITRGGQNPITLEGGQTRTYIQDGDTVTMRAHAQKDGIRVGFGEVTGKIIP